VPGTVERPIAAAQVRVALQSIGDLVLARREGRQMAEQLGFSASEATLVATAISELARNIVNYAGQGEIILRPVSDARRRGINVVAQDEGPGIADTDLALKVGFSTGGGLGLGLPGVMRIMDEFSISSEPGRRTLVSVTKWLQR